MVFFLKILGNRFLLGKDKKSDTLWYKKVTIYRLLPQSKVGLRVRTHAQRKGRNPKRERPSWSITDHSTKTLQMLNWSFLWNDK